MTRKSELTQKRMIYQLHQAVIGIEENPSDNGLIGDIAEMNSKLDRLNGRVRRNEVRSKVNQGVLGTLGGGGILGAIGKLMNLW